MADTNLTFDFKYYFQSLFAIVVLFCNYCFSVYFIYIHIFFFTPFSSLLFVSAIFLLFPPHVVERITDKIRFKCSQNLTSTDVLALSLSLSIFCFALLFNSLFNFLSNTEEKIFHLPQSLQLITNLQPALLIKYGLGIEHFATSVSSTGLRLVSDDTIKKICLKHYPHFCNHRQGLPVLLQLDMTQYLANFIIFPSDSRIFLLYIIVLLF